MSDTKPRGCSEPQCCAGPMDRRHFLQVAGAGAAAVAGSAPLVAGPFEPRDTTDHFVPADKKLNPEWVRTLFARGEPAWYTGEDLATIGMPVGGICAGQVYLSGDGRLVTWEIFNQNTNTGYGQVNYKVARKPIEVVRKVREMVPARALEQGFALRVHQSGASQVRTLDSQGFPGVRFRGEYPIGRVEYRAEDFPLAVSLEAYSPFIPLEAEDSALPATILEYRVTNTSADRAEVVLAGWLQDGVCRFSGPSFGERLELISELMNLGELGSVVQGGARLRPRAEVVEERAPIVLADFEGGDYGDWEVSGKAFGKAPAGGTLEGQQAVSGFAGKGLVNTFLDGDGPQGKLISPPFRIERPILSFLVGGGDHERETCINLLVGGKIVRSACGRNRERLEPCNWDVREFSSRRARIEIVDASSDRWGHINIDQIELRDTPMRIDPGELRLQSDWGTMALGILEPEEVVATTSSRAAPGSEAFFAELAGGDQPRARAGLSSPPRGALGQRFALRPGEERTLRFVVAWNLPNMRRGSEIVGNYYARRFRNAAAVIRYIARDFERLASATRLWRDTWYDSTLPWWLLDRLHSTVANLATTTCQWWRNGRFWAWEGCGCCSGTCGHVWNYAHALARLFPGLERSVREMQDFAPGVGFDPESGAIAFRGRGTFWAGDAQGGYLLKALREHQCSQGRSFLERNWSNIRKALEFLIDQDGDANGLLEGSQHNTYDINYFGPNTMVGSLYLAALRAAEVMAREVGDEAFAARCRAIFSRGSALSAKELFNGEYFIQRVDLKEHPEHQIGQGCLADQLFGQGWAHQVGLGYIYPRETVLAALRSIWKYCWAPDVGPQNRHHKPERWFAYPGEAGLFTCTWPKSPHLGPKSTRYRNEIWTGIEYQVAGHMAWEGMVTEALAICRGVHERYHPSKHNPWNEIECGDHYARALASWGVLIALAGFEADGPRGHFGFAPRINPERFRCAFTSAAGWGSLEQRRDGEEQIERIEIRRGELRVKTLAFEVPVGFAVAGTRVKIAGREVEIETRRAGARIEIELALEARVRDGEVMEVRLGG